MFVKLLAMTVPLALVSDPAPLTLDHWIAALRCRERPTIDARMACYGAAARLLNTPAKAV